MTPELDAIAAVPCVHCRYDLRAAPRDGRCPECGNAVSDSLHVNMFRNASRYWIVAMRRGLSLLKIACWLFWISLGSNALQFTVWEKSGSYVLALGTAIGFGLSVLLAFGAAFLFGTADPSAQRRDWDRQHRRIRIGVACAAISLLLWFVIGSMRLVGTVFVTLASITVICGLVGSVLLGWFIPRLLERLQRQAGFERAEAALAHFFFTCTVACIVIGVALASFGEVMSMCLILAGGAAALATILCLHVLATQTARCARFAVRE